MDRILRSLPEWFGVEEAVERYIDSASRQESFLAVVDDETVGIALLRRHFLESALVADGCLLLQVHTVGPSFENAAYAQTRAFYRKAGFLPVQEFDGIDWAGPTLVLVKPLVQKSARYGFPLRAEPSFSLSM